MNCRYLKPSFVPFDNQISNAKELLKRRRAILTDKVGSGKTCSILLAFSVLKERNKVNNLVVLTPLSAYSKKVWYKDITKFTNLRSIDIETLQTKYENSTNKLSLLLSQYDVIYGKHTHCKTIQNLLQEICKLPGTVLCLDEAHAFKNPKSALTISAKSLILSSLNCWFITGTTLSKNLEDVYNIVNLIYPWYLGSFTSFRDTFCETRDKVIGKRNGRLIKVQTIIGIKNEDLLEQKLSPLLIKGESFTEVNFHFVDYNLSQEESSIYRRLSKGLDFDSNLTSEDWISKVLSDDIIIEEHPIKDIERYSSRFIYLQTAADGVLTNRGTQDKINSTKIDRLISLVKEITLKGRSCIIYFDYIASLDAVKKRLSSEVDAVILESSGRHVLDENAVTEQKVKLKSHIILGTKASSESVSYYFIGDVIFFHIPTVCHVFTQTVGRICRKNTLFPGDMHCWIFRSDNIDLYKLLVVSSKSYQMEAVQGEEKNIPNTYKKLMQKSEIIEQAKKLLLWKK